LEAVAPVHLTLIAGATYCHYWVLICNLWWILIILPIFTSEWSNDQNVDDSSSI